MSRNSLNDEDWELAYRVITNTAFLDINDFTEILHKNNQIERQVIKHQLYEQLSDEAKEVINIIINGPSEVYNQFISPIKKIISKNRIKEFLSFYWKSKFIAELTIKEIEEWVNQL